MGKCFLQIPSSMSEQLQPASNSSVRSNVFSSLISHAFSSNICHEDEQVHNHALIASLMDYVMGVSYTRTHESNYQLSFNNHQSGSGKQEHHDLIWVIIPSICVWHDSGDNKLQTVVLQRAHT